MPDLRFFEDLGPVSLSELAQIGRAELADAGEGARLFHAAGPLARVGADAISFYAERRYLDDLTATAAGACYIAPQNVQHAPAGCALLVTPEPHAAYAAAANRLHRPRRWRAGDPAIHPTAVLEEGVELGVGVVVGAGVQIGARTRVGPNTTIGPGVAIGRDCEIAGQVTIGFALIGDRVNIFAGAIIGEPGFGVTHSAGRAIDVPQLGRVIIQDEVTVGALTCIDRGAWDDTIVGEYTKIDNLVQIAHNVHLGRNCLLAAQTGIAGSVVVGDGVAFGGRAGVMDHLAIGAGARIAGTSGVMKDVPAGEMWVGSPARPIRRFMRETAWLAKMARERKDSIDDE